MAGVLAVNVLLTLKDYDVSLRHRWDVDRLFRSVFFESVVFYLKLDFEATDLWLARLERENSWVTRFVMSLIGLAAEIRQAAEALRASNLGVVFLRTVTDRAS